MRLLETVIFLQQDNFYIVEISFSFYLKLFLRIKINQTLLILTKQSLSYTLYFSMILYFEKTLCNVA